MRRHLLELALVLVMGIGCPPRPPRSDGLSPAAAGSTPLRIGVVSALIKVRPMDRPTGDPTARLKAARNEFEPFQVVLTSASGGPIEDVSVRVSQLPTGPEGFAFPAQNVVLYRVGYYEVVTPSVPAAQTAGLWPDPLIPVVDTYAGERRNAFPMTVPGNESRVVWVDLLVPPAAPPGDYRGALEVLVGQRVVGKVPIALRVGRFALPSTASLPTAFGLEYEQPCKAHTGHESCSVTWDERAASTLRARYVRAGLEHRISISGVFWQPPVDDSARIFERSLHPYVAGTAQDLRLAGARLTTVALTPGDELQRLASFVAYAERRGFLDRTFYLPDDEPSGEHWTRFVQLARKARAVDGRIRVALTCSALDDATGARALDQVDILAAAINVLDGRGEDAAAELDRYRSWRKRAAGRALWGYQSCRSHGCAPCPGDDGGDTPASGGDEGPGWPTRAIDTSAVQNRAFAWHAFRLGLDGELYADVARRLSTAWDKDGLCWASGAGDGTLFYPGTATRIGGKTDIPIESIRLKLIREGMEDYEYLALLASREPDQARAAAADLFPRAHACDRTAAELLSARDALFDLLDRP